MTHLAAVENKGNGPRLVATCGTKSGDGGLVVASQEVFLEGLNNPMAPRCPNCLSVCN